MPEPMSGLPTDAEYNPWPKMQDKVPGQHEFKGKDNEPSEIARDEWESENMVAPMPPEYVAAHEFLSSLFGPDGYTPDSVGQLVEVFIPCLRIMCDREGHPWAPNGELWRSAGVLNLTGDVYKKHERFQYRLWTMGIMHKDSGFDLINFIAFCLRSDPDSRFGVRGEPAGPGDES